ncbi:MAG TPA: 4-hydroxy-tetrahydrodipicolinate synthase [Actinomycetota bacterium]|nr:4-hydroxy-tetrahydrodipicolinate synthase [Actinomycetota bacterium]
MELGRVITAMATPFAKDGSLDLDGAARLARHLVDHGSDGLVIAGTTGESPTLTHEEKRDLWTAVAEAIKGTAPMIAGTGTYSTKESIELTETAREAGADAILVVTPYYSKPPQSGLAAHFKAIAAATDLPIILYDIPGRTAKKIEHPTLLELAKVPNIVGVKDAAADLAGTGKLAAEAPAFKIWSGDDALTLSMLAVGAVGVVSVASHLVGHRIREMIAAHDKGDVEGAAQINRELVPLFEALFITANPIPLKAALEMVGLPAGPVRLPLVDATKEERDRVSSALAGLGLI